MKISYKTVVIGEHTGYGNASRLLTTALRDRGVEILPDLDVRLNFCMPPDYEFGDRLTIGYTPWESTEVPQNWVAGLKAVDDLWVTSGFVKDVFARYRKNRAEDIFVLPHGIENCWEPVGHRRDRSRPFRFLHVGEPAERKGGELVLEAWHKAFKDRKDVELWMKCVKYPRARVKDKSGSIIASPGMFENNLKIISHVMTQQELWDLYRNVDCLVYPTRGEGWGLIPWEAQASGLPTIVPALGVASDVALHSTLQLQNYEWVPSDNQQIHPGEWLDLDVDELILKMQVMVRDYDYYAGHQEFAASRIHKNYSWESVADQAIERIEYMLTKYEPN